jgi:hypothetical protein
MRLDVTQSVTKDDLAQDPCPYFCIRDALPVDIYEQLVAEYPEAHMMQDGKTHFQARRYRQHEFVPGTVSALWQEFVEYHNSREYKDRVLDLFEPALERYYPSLVDDLRSAAVSRRHDSQPGTVQLEVQFVLNGLQEETVRTPHLDNSRELFAGLLYMRKPEDASTGGDIHVFRKTVADPEYTGIREVNPDHVVKAGSVPYRANTMILFLNTHDTIHGVTPRLGANCLRRYVNIDAHQDRKLFTI